MDSSLFKSYNFYKQIGITIQFGLKMTEHRVTLASNFGVLIKKVPEKGKEESYEITINYPNLRLVSSKINYG